MKRMSRIPKVSAPNVDTGFGELVVPNFTADEEGNVIAVSVPASEGICVPQDGSRLELRNVAKYGVSLDDDRFVTPNVLDPMALADYTHERLSKLDVETIKDGDYEE